MIGRRASLLTAVVALASFAALMSAPTGLAASAPAWKLSFSSQPTNFAPDSSGESTYFLLATNIGTAPTTGKKSSRSGGNTACYARSGRV